MFLKNIQTNVNSGLLLVYGLIVFVILSIIIILIVDKVHRTKEESTFHNRHLKKRLKELQAAEEEKELITWKENDSKEKEVEATSLGEPPVSVMEEITTAPNSKKEQSLLVQEEKVTTETVSTSDLVENATISSESKIEPEDELEKTQAQIEVEAITKALEKAVEEEKELNKYAKFEEEQEQNAIISYEELKEKFDELYDSNEKIQYMNDDTIPINLKELYETNEIMVKDQSKEETIVSNVNPPEKRQTPIDYSKMERKESEFKSSPIISPVYGIQKKELQVKKEMSSSSTDDLQKTTEFLNSLKELQKNLD